MEGRLLNRRAELLGEALYRASRGDLFWEGVTDQLLDEEGHHLTARQLLMGVKALSARWRDRLSGKDAGADQEPALHSTEEGRLLATDYPPAPGGGGERHKYLDADGVERHVARQVAYGALQQPVHPDVNKVVADVARVVPTDA